MKLLREKKSQSSSRRWGKSLFRLWIHWFGNVEAKKAYMTESWFELRYCYETFLFGTRVGRKLLISVTQDSRCWSAMVFRRWLARGIFWSRSHNCSTWTVWFPLRVLWADQFQHLSWSSMKECAVPGGEVSAWHAEVDAPRSPSRTRQGNPPSKLKGLKVPRDWLKNSCWK